jgi:ABC-type transport system involved in multi-copper enzyme maturation permease subunit
MNEASVQQSAISNPRLLPACLHLFRLSLRRQFFSRQTLVSVVLTLFTCLLVVGWTFGRDPSVKRLAERVLVPIFGSFLLPIYAICYAASSIGSEREERTLVYLLNSPLPRPVVYLVKYLAATALALGWSCASFLAVCLLFTPRVRESLSFLTVRQLAEVSDAAWGREALELFWPAVLLAALAYASLFHTLGAIFRRGTIISLAYAFFVEMLLSRMPGIVKRMAVSYYYSCMIYDAGAEHRVRPRLSPELFLPVSGTTAATALAAASVVLLVIGMLVFTRREYRDVS